jgi:acetyltransferase-like isoleucine patch superfamily enzyme
MDYLRSTFENSNVWLVTDSKKIKKRIENRRHQVWLYEENNSLWTNIKLNMDFPMDFRNGFWFLTIKRFLALESFMRVEPNKALHVEADVFLMPNFPIKHFDELEQEMAFPIAAPDNGVASTLFIKNINAISNLNRYVEKISLANNQLSDMNLLYKYQQNYPARVKVLPSGPSNEEVSAGYFDGMAFGTYLLGQDPRNRRGWSLKYSAIDWHADKVENLEYCIEGESLYAKANGNKISIYSLHIHCKNSKLFNLENIKKELLKGAREHKYGPKKIFETRVIIPIIIASLRRRIRRFQ